MNELQCVYWSDGAVVTSKMLDEDELEHEMARIREDARVYALHCNCKTAVYASKQHIIEDTMMFYYPPLIYSDSTDSVIESFHNHDSIQSVHAITRPMAVPSDIKELPGYVASYIDNSTYCYTQKYKPDIGYTITVLAKTRKQKREAFKRDIDLIVAWANKISPDCASVVHFPDEHEWVYKKRQAILTIYYPAMYYLIDRIKENPCVRSAVK